MADQGRRLILVRHSLPLFVTGVPASHWHLSAEGRRRCRKLAERLAPYSLTAVVASEEHKAVETGQIAAEILGLPFQTAPGLHEHEREAVQSTGHAEDFQAQVARFFEHPAELVLGYETADQAHARFYAAVARVLAGHAEDSPSGSCPSGRTLAIVSHGTVMTLLITRANGLDPFPFWASLGLPAFAVLSLPDLRLLAVVTEP
jgi:broad specificity phosphatase PhoE